MGGGIEAVKVLHLIPERPDLLALYFVPNSTEPRLTIPEHMSIWYYAGRSRVWHVLSSLLGGLEVRYCPYAFRSGRTGAMTPY